MSAAPGGDRPRRVGRDLALLNHGDARRSLATEAVGIPHLADSAIVAVAFGPIPAGFVSAERWTVFELTLTVFAVRFPDSR
jgi:hypothetical protein